MSNVVSAPPKLLGARKIKLAVAAGSLAALGLGTWLAPPSVQTPLPAAEEHAAPLLEEQVQLREVSRPFRGVQDVTRLVRAVGVAIPYGSAVRHPVVSDFSVAASSEDAVGFGVIVSGTQVLTHVNAVRGRESVSVQTAEGSRDMRFAAYEPATGLVLLESEVPIGSPAAMADEPPTAGMLAVAAASFQGRDVAIPLFVTSVAPDRYTVSGSGSRVVQTMPVYTVEGKLLAIISGEGPEGHALPAGPAVQRLLARASTGERLASIGAAFQELTPSLQQAFGEGGVLLSDVMEGGPADLAGAQAGDVLLRVGETDVTTIEQAVTAVNAMAVGTATPLEVRRSDRRRSVQVTPSAAYQVAWLARGQRSSAAGSVEARVLFDAEVLDRLGVPPDTRVLSVNGRAVSSSAQVAREMRRAKLPLRVLLHDGEKQFFAAIAARE
jgi:hypothetical protein